MKNVILFSLILVSFILRIEASGENEAKPRVWIFSEMSDSRLPGPNHRGTINDPDDISVMAGCLTDRNLLFQGVLISASVLPRLRGCRGEGEIRSSWR